MKDPKTIRLLIISNTGLTTNEYERAETAFHSQSPAQKILLSRVEQRVSKAEKDIRHSKDWEDFLKRRAFIEALETVKGIIEKPEP